MPLAYYITRQGAKLTPEECAALSDASITAAFGFPAPIARCLTPPERERYCEVSATELLGDLRYQVLKRRIPYAEDPSEGLWRMVGIGFHAALEKANGKAGAAEVRLVAEVEGIKVGATLDMLTDEGDIIDWKTTSAWGGKRVNEAWPLLTEQTDWWEQLEIQAALAHLNGRKVRSAAIFAIFRDWSATEAVKNRDGFYPKSNSAEYRMPLHDKDVLVALLTERVKAWKQAMATPEAQLPPCQNLYGTDRASGLPKRCVSYCPVSDQCSAFAAWKRGKGR